MAYSDYGARIWCNDEEVTPNYADRMMFADLEFAGTGGAIFENLSDRYFNDEPSTYENIQDPRLRENLERCYHAVLGDGDVRLGIYKESALSLIRKTDDGFEILADTYLGINQFRKFFNIGYKSKHFFKERGIKYSWWEPSEPIYPPNYFPSSSIGFGKNDTKQTILKKIDTVKKQDWWKQKQPKSKRAMAKNQWFYREIGDIRILGGIDILFKPVELDYFDNKNNSEVARIVKEVIDEKQLVTDTALFRFAADFGDGKIWTVRIGSCYGNGFDSEPATHMFGKPELTLRKRKG